MADNDFELALVLDALALLLWGVQEAGAALPLIGGVFSGFVGIFTAVVFGISIVYGVSLVAGTEETLESVKGVFAGLFVTGVSATSLFSGAVSVIIIAVAVLIGLAFAAILAQWAWIPVALIGYVAANPETVTERFK